VSILWPVMATNAPSESFASLGLPSVCEVVSVMGRDREAGMEKRGHRKAPGRANCLSWVEDDDPGPQW
jgi:hypothetical protein